MALQRVQVAAALSARVVAIGPEKARKFGHILETGPFESTLGLPVMHGLMADIRVSHAAK
jgi:hypothetical protein